MGRRRLHDERTRANLLAAAECLAAEGGVDAVSVRCAALRAGTTTRAVYALFGSKKELVQALAQRTFALLMERVAAVPLTNDPRRDPVMCAVNGFRRVAAGGDAAQVGAEAADAGETTLARYSRWRTRTSSASFSPLNCRARR